MASYIIVDIIFFGNKAEKVALENAVNKSVEREDQFKSFINKSTSTLKAIRESKQFKDYLSTNNLSYITDTFTTLSNSSQDFMQIRYIDKNGYEKIRVDKDNQISKVIPKDKLQNKSNRYYFKESINKELEKVWFSALDLNIENSKVEKPYKPTLRAILPIKQNDKFAGILIINYHMKKFLKNLFYTPLYEMTLADTDGNILVHNNSEYCWSKYKKDSINLQDIYKSDFKNIVSMSIYKNEKFVSKILDLPIQNRVVLILKLNSDYIKKQKDDLFRQYSVVYFITMILSIFLSLFIITIFKKILLDLQIDNRRLKSLAYIDKLTKIYNRRYFENQLEEIFKSSDKDSNEYSLIMFDIDRFKRINDEFGHDVGDMTLKFLSDTVKDNTKGNDIIARWGGEEFMILTENSLEKASKMAENLKDSIEQQSKKEQSIPKFTASFGVISLNNYDSLDEALKTVDTLLYISKKDGRNRVSTCCNL
jgi:diguanylate cyclase (GGDEF)-like protein